MNSAVAKDESLVLARRLVDAIESGDSHGAGDLLEALQDGRFEALFQEIGKLTRELHDTFSNLATDERLVVLAHEQMPDARDRLNYVVAKTEEAADRTLSAAESMQALNDGLRARAGSLRETLAAPGVDGVLREQVSGFLDAFESGCDTMRGHVTEVMLAQEYQDLTGQVIKRTIGLVNQVEEKLVSLVSACGAVTRAARSEPTASCREESHGPAVRPDEQVVTRQADVDELLANLGF